MGFLKDQIKYLYQSSVHIKKKKIDCMSLMYNVKIHSIHKAQTTVHLHIQVIRRLYTVVFIINKKLVLCYQGWRENTGAGN